MRLWGLTDPQGKRTGQRLLSVQSASKTAAPNGRATAPARLHPGDCEACFAFSIRHNGAPEINYLAIPCVWQNDALGNRGFEAAAAPDTDLACPLLQFSALSWWLGFRI